MARYWHLEVRTDERVHRVVRHFERRAGWTVVREIDSLNYGEGHDLTCGTVAVRLFDDQRSDAVVMRTIRQLAPDWEKEMAEVVREMAGTVWLKFEIDGANQAAPEDRERTVESLREILLESGYLPEDIRVESG